MSVRRNRREQSGVSLILAITSLLMVVPMVGLIVDVGVLYAVKSRLQASVDGAALAAARALTLGATTAAQAASARANAVNWFYANFPSGNWSTSGTAMSTSNVQVYDDASNPNLRHVDITASTRVPTYFMKWFNFNSTTINAIGNASRRDAVVMLVLDRSGSMCSPGASPCNNTGACGSMKTAAKLFTGQFAAGRDYIGLVSFSDGVYVHSVPTRDFRTVLGFATSSSSGAGAIDTIQCQGGTNSAQAVSMGYNELYKMNLPGALNILVFESDGLPNTMTVNMWDGAAFGFANLGTSGSPQGCKDASGKAAVSGGWASFSNRKLWTGTASPTSAPGTSYNMNSGGTGFISNIPAGPVGTIYSSDPSQTKAFTLFGDPWDTSGNSGLNLYSSTLAPSCKFVTSSSDTSDIKWLPNTDVFGNSVNPASHPYKSVTMSGTHLQFDASMTTATKWTNYHNAALNATDNAAYRARANANLPSSVFVIGLGGQGSDPPDYTLMQRMANDPLPDSFNSPALYTACSSNPNCFYYSNQPRGTFIFSSNQTQLKQAFLQLSSQILRLSQ